jgi:hypothetical protein
VTFYASDGVSTVRTRITTPAFAVNRLTKTDNGQTTVYTYDANDRLTSVGAMTYTYDADRPAVPAWMWAALLATLHGATEPEERDERRRKPNVLH